MYTLVVRTFQYSGDRYIVMQRGGSILSRAVLLKRNSVVGKIIRYGERLRATTVLRIGRSRNLQPRNGMLFLDKIQCRISFAITNKADVREIGDQNGQCVATFRTRRCALLLRFQFTLG